MSLVTTLLSDSLPSSIPKLNSTSLNWAIFSVRFQDAVEAKGCWGHFYGSEPRPVVSAVTTTAEGDEDAQMKLAEALAMQQLQWDKNERSAKSLLTQKIPDLTLMRVHSKKSVKERWDAIVVEYTSKGVYAQTDLRQKFMEMRCADNDNVREFLDDLRVKQEELASVGVDIDEKDYRSTILASLPFALSNFASVQLAAARMWAPTKTIDPDDLISLINEDYDRQKAQRTRRYGKARDNDDSDEAMSASPSSSRWKGGKGGARRPRGECWNCGEVGHFRDKCPKPVKSSKKAKDKEGAKKAGEANTMIDWNSDSEGAWAAEEIDGEIVVSSGATPSLGLSDLSTAGMPSD